MSTSYVLLAAVGQSPQVLTETVWSLARQEAPPMRPERVEVISTAVGAAYVRGLLLGEEAYNPATGEAVGDGTNRWARCCQEILGCEEIPLTIHVPAPSGTPLPDIKGVSDDEQFGDLCYRLVAELTREGALPLVGSIAGGRKTMSAHLMTAFSLFARPQDRLTHVLVSPQRFERDRGFFYITPETAGEAHIHRVDIPYPRVRALLDEPLLSGLEKPGLSSVLKALDPHLAARRTPDTLQFHLGDREAWLILYQDGEELGRQRLTPTPAATFAVLFEAIAACGGRCPFGELHLEDESRRAQRIHNQRASIADYCFVTTEPQPWSKATKLSKSISEYNRKLSESPVLEKHLLVESEETETGSVYYWSRPLPETIRLTTDFAVDTWPFDHLPRPVEEKLPAAA